MIRKLKVINIIGFFMMIGINIAVVMIPLNGVYTKDISNKYPDLLTPSDNTFLIWFLIYFTLFIFTIYQISKSADKTVELIGILFFFSTILNSAWLILWHYDQIGASLIVMTILLISLLAIYYKINKDRYGTSLIFVRLPFNLYLAWICIAMTAQVSVFLKSIGWDMSGLSEQTWTVFVLTFVLILTSYMILKKKDILFGLVVLWFITGVLIKHIDGFDKGYPYVIGTIIAMYLVIVIENIYYLYRTMSK